MMSKLDRYIAGEMVGPFLFGAAVVVLLFEGSILFPLISVIVDKHVPLMQVARLLLLKVPWLIVWAAPVAMLFASALTVNRLGRDNEITCMRAAGVSLRRIFAPIFVVGAAMSVMSFVVGERVVPRAERDGNRIMNEVWLSQSMPEIQPDLFFRTDNFVFYVRAAQKKLDSRDVIVENVMIYRLPEGGESYPEFLTAKRGESRGMIWTFYDVWTTKANKAGWIVEQHHLDRTTLNLQRAVEDLWMEHNQTQEMSLKELKKQMDQFAKGGLPTSAMAVDYHLRLSIPLSCLIFAMVSAPLALRFSRAGGFAGLLLSVILGFLYYNTIFLGKILGEREVLSPALAGWMQDILFGFAGLYLVGRSD